MPSERERFEIWIAGLLFGFHFLSLSYLTLSRGNIAEIE